MKDDRNQQKDRYTEDSCKERKKEVIENQKREGRKLWSNNERYVRRVEYRNKKENRKEISSMLLS